jgi:glycosyltransferase involved in cell wall biosynthesis
VRILAPHPDSFGGYGGIAAASRHFLRAVCAMDGVEEVVALPRRQPSDMGESLPDTLTWRADSLGGKVAFLKTLLKTLLRLLATDRNFDLIWCGHLHLVPFALLARRLTGAPVAVQVHGIEAWAPTEKWLANQLAGRVNAFISVSETTKERLVEWSGLAPEQGVVVPNTIDFGGLTPGPKSPELLDRYELHDRYVLMTMGRLVGKERRKGFDRVLEALPAVADKRPDVSYLIAGKGPDQPRLEQKAEDLGVRDRVTFTGFVPEREKADHFRLADLFAMPSEGEGFGLVLLEALACGTPVVASTQDGGREAVAEGEFGRLVDSNDSTAVVEALTEPPAAPSRQVVVDQFGPKAYQRRIERVVESLVADGDRSHTTFRSESSSSIASTAE